MGLFTIDAATSARLARLERKVDALMAHFQVTLQDEEFKDIRDLAASGQKIAAIKLYRDRTGAGLAEAKDVIERGAFGHSKRR